MSDTNTAFDAWFRDHMPSGDISVYRAVEFVWNRWQEDVKRLRGEAAGAPCSAGMATPQEFPYQQTFDAIAAATELWPSKDAVTGISISVRKFQNAFNNHRDASPPVGVAQAAPEPLSLQAVREDERLACWKIADKERTALKNADPTKAAWLVAFDIANAIKMRGTVVSSTDQAGGK